jgi:hypothetical protein
LLFSDVRSSWPPVEALALTRILKLTAYVHGSVYMIA